MYHGRMDPERVVTDFCNAITRLDVEELTGFFTEDAIYHNMPIQAVQGKDAIKGLIEQFTAAFEKGDWEVKNIAAAGDVVLTERIDRFIGQEKNMSLRVMGVFELSGGKIAAWRDYFDMAEWTRQAS